MKTQIVDINGKTVHVGTKVKILSLPDSLLSRVPKDEALRLKAMIGEIFIVDGIDEYGGVWVEKDFDGDEEGQLMSHSVSLASHEMQIVEI